MRFDVKDAAGTAIDATVTLKKGYTGLTAGTDGSYALTVGEKYTYTVEKNGYEKVTQEFTAQEGNNTITVTMVKLPVITLTVSPADATVKLTKTAARYLMTPRTAVSTSISLPRIPTTPTPSASSAMRRPPARSVLRPPM